MSRIDELRLMAKVAKLYYKSDMSQSKIAAQLDLSQSTISRLLKKAVAAGIVRISVNSPVGVYADMETTIEDCFGLKEVIIVDSADRNADMLHSIGSAAAHYVETTIKKDEIIGISSWSETLLAMVDEMQPLTRAQNIKVVQILGGVGNPGAEVYAARLTERLARLVKGEAIFLPAPGVTGSAEAREMLLNEQYIAETVELFNKVSLALVGIGAIEPSKLLASSGNVFAHRELERLSEEGAVGDICLRFFDRDGEPVDTDLDQRVIGMSLTQMRQIKRTVGVAGGQRKREAILGAIRGKLINVLITDHDTAQWLINIGQSQDKKD